MWGGGRDGEGAGRTLKPGMTRASALQAQKPQIRHSFSCRPLFGLAFRSSPCNGASGHREAEEERRESRVFHRFACERLTLRETATCMPTAPDKRQQFL